MAYPSLRPIEWPHATRRSECAVREALAMAARVTLLSVDRASVADTATADTRCATSRTEEVALGPQWLVLDWRPRPPRVQAWPS